MNPSAPCSQKTSTYFLPNKREEKNVTILCSPLSHHPKEKWFEGSQASPFLSSDETCIKMML
jgi:hypothetical protein